MAAKCDNWKNFFVNVLNNKEPNFNINKKELTAGINRFKNYHPDHACLKEFLIGEPKIFGKEDFYFEKFISKMKEIEDEEKLSDFNLANFEKNELNKKSNNEFSEIESVINLTELIDLNSNSNWFDTQNYYNEAKTKKTSNMFYTYTDIQERYVKAHEEKGEPEQGQGHFMNDTYVKVEGRTYPATFRITENSNSTKIAYQIQVLKQCIELVLPFYDHTMGYLQQVIKNNFIMALPMRNKRNKDELRNKFEELLSPFRIHDFQPEIKDNGNVELKNRKSIWIYPWMYNKAAYDEFIYIEPPTNPKTFTDVFTLEKLLFLFKALKDEIEKLKNEFQLLVNFSPEDQAFLKPKFKVHSVENFPENLRTFLEVDETYTPPLAEAAVGIANGKLAVENPATFYKKLMDFFKKCTPPPTPEQVKKYLEEYVVKTGVIDKDALTQLQNTPPTIGGKRRKNIKRKTLKSKRTKKRRTHKKRRLALK